MSPAPGRAALRRRWRRRGDVVTRLVAGETLLVPVRGNVADMRRVFTLNETGAAAWGLLDGERPLAAVVAELVARFEVEADRAGADLLGLLETLAREDLAEEVAG